MSHTSSSEDEEPRDSDDCFDLEAGSTSDAYCGKVNVFLLTHTVEVLPRSDFLDMRVTQAFNNNLIASVHESWIHIMFYSSTTFRLPALRRDLAAVVPRSKYRIIQKKLTGSSKGDIFWDGDRFYCCVDNNEKTTFDQQAVVSSIVKVENFLRAKFNLKKGPNGEKVHLFYLSNGDSKWRVKTFASIKERNIALTNLILSTKPDNFYCNTDRKGHYTTKKGVSRSNPVIPRGELAPVDKYARVGEMVRITDPPPRKKLEEKLKSHITPSELEALVDERFAERKAAIEAEIRAQMDAFFQERMRTTAFECSAGTEAVNLSFPQSDETAGKAKVEESGKGKAWRSGPTKFKSSLKSKGATSTSKDFAVKKKLLPAKTADESIFIGISDSEPSSPELIPRTQEPKLTPRKEPSTEAPKSPPLSCEHPITQQVTAPEIAPTETPKIAPWETKIIPGILSQPPEKVSSEYVSASGGTSSSSLTESQFLPEHSPLKKKPRTYRSRDPAFQPRLTIRDSPGLVALRTRSQKQSRMEEEKALLASARANLRVHPEPEATDDGTDATEDAPKPKKSERDPRTLGI